MVVEVNTEEMYKIIKKQNGENFAKILRQNVLLDIPNLKHILEFAGTDVEDAKNLIPVLREIRKKSQKITETKQEEIKDPIELLNEAGYDAFYVHNLRQQNSIAQYFRSDERLCTFKDSHRYKDFYIIHAVRKNVKDIKRGNPPKREDEYGTSVISIQIAKKGGFISIKNRYNHTIDNPDATFNNNPDNIIRGLTTALKHKFGVDFMTQEVEIPDNYRIVKNQLVRFNYEIDNVYYGNKYYFKGSEITKLNPDYEIMLDNVILDKRVGNVKNINQGAQDLSQVLNNEISGHKIKTETDKSTGETVINIIDENKNIKELARTKNGCITSLHLYKTSEIGSEFLRGNTVLETLYAPKLKKMGAHSFFACHNLKNLHIPELAEMGMECFARSYELTELNAPKLKIMKPGCFARSEKMKNLYIPELEEMGYGCFSEHNKELAEFNAPKLKKIGNCCFVVCHKLKKLYVPELKEMSAECFANVRHLHEFVAPKLKKMGPGCFSICAMIFKKLYVPELEEMKWDCFSDTKIIQNLYAPKLKFEKWTPKSIRRAAKLAKLKNGIRNVLHLPQRDLNETDISNFQSLQREF